MDLKLSTLGPLGATTANAGPTPTTGDGETAGNFASDLAAMMSGLRSPASGASSPLAGLGPPAAASSVEPVADRGLAALAKLLSEGLAAGAIPEAQARPPVRSAKPTSADAAAAALPETQLLAALASLMVAAKPGVSAAGPEKVSATPIEVAADPDAALPPAMTSWLGMAVELGLVARPTAGGATPQASKPDATMVLSTLAARLSASVVQGTATTTAPTTTGGHGIVGGSSSPLAALNLAGATPPAPAGAVSMLDTLAAILDPAAQPSAPASAGIVLEGIADPAGVPTTVAAPVANPQSSPVERAGLPSALSGPLEIRHPQAPRQLADSVIWHLDQGVHEIRIRVNPEALGPLEVKLRLDGEKVAVRFDMADASVRDVVQTSLPSLSTLLSARGLELQHAQVFSQDRGQSQPGFGGAEAAEARTGIEVEESRPATRLVSRRGLIDDYV